MFSERATPAETAATCGWLTSTEEVTYRAEEDIFPRLMTDDTAQASDADGDLLLRRPLLAGIWLSVVALVALLSLFGRVRALIMSR